MPQINNQDKQTLKNISKELDLTHSQLPEGLSAGEKRGNANTHLYGDDVDNGTLKPLSNSPADILLIRRYNDFSNKCVLEGMRNIKEIAELFRVREELRLA